jgi:5-methylthioadenosine/S-adenosylhomocysteine deaminase
MTQEKVDLLIRGGYVLTINSDDQVFPEADIAIQGDKILAIAPKLDVDAREIIDGEGKVVMPGLINTHMHETLPRGICEDLPLNRWLEEICFPLDRSYTHEIMMASAMMNQAEMILAGTTTFIDIYRYPGACAEVAVNSGLRAILAPQIMSSPVGVGESVDSAEAFVAEWSGSKKHERVIPAFGPHAPYSCTPDDLDRIAELAMKYDTPIHSHLSETLWENETIRERYHSTPAEYYDAHGILSKRLSVAHGVHLSDSDMDLLSRLGVSVIYNPTSNMKLASGIARVGAMQQAGINVCIGTDSNLSNNNLDLWEEIRLGAILQKLATSDATVLPCSQLLRMITINGAKALGLDDQIGSLEPGKRADLILLDLSKPHLWPQIREAKNNTIEQLVYSANAADVSHTIANGKVLMADRQMKTLDLKDVEQKVILAARQLMANAGFSK